MNVGETNKLRQSPEELLWLGNVKLREVQQDLFTD
jgi:hypothetical protein